MYVSTGNHPTPETSSWTGGNGEVVRRTTQLQEPVESIPSTPVAEDSDEDWLDAWVKEYEARPGWGEHEEQVSAPLAIHTSRTPVSVLASVPAPGPAPGPGPAPAPAPTAIETSTASRVDNVDTPPLAPNPTRQETHQDKPCLAPTANKQGFTLSRPSMPTPPATSRRQEEVVAVKELDLRPHISLAPIRTGREKNEVKQVATKGEDLARSTEHVTHVQALQSIEKLLQMEMGAPKKIPPSSQTRDLVQEPKTSRLGISSDTKSEVSLAKEPSGPQTNVKGSVLTGKGHVVEATEKNRNKIAVGTPDIAEETPLLRHLKTSRSEKQVRVAAYSSLPQRSFRSIGADKIHPPPQFSPRLLQSLQPAPPKSFSPRMLQNLSTAPLGNPVEKIPQWVYDGLQERPELQVSAVTNQSEVGGEKLIMNLRGSEQAVKVLPTARRRTHAPRPVQLDITSLQGRLKVCNPKTPKLLPVELTRTLKDNVLEVTRGFSPRRASVAASPRRDAAVKQVPAESILTSTSQDNASDRTHGLSPQRGPVAASTLRAQAALSTYRASLASSPSRASSIAASPRLASVVPSTHKAALVAASSLRASIELSPQKSIPSPSLRGSLSVTSSPRRTTVSSSPYRASVASSPHRTSGTSTSSIPPSRRRRHSSKHASVPIESTILQMRIEDRSLEISPLSGKDLQVDGPSEEYVPIEQEVKSLRLVEVQETGDAVCTPPREANPSHLEEASLRWSRSHSARRPSPRKSRRRLEPRRVVMSQEKDMFPLKKSMSLRNGQTLKFIDSSSDDEHETTPRASRRSERTIKPLVWRSRSLQTQDDTDD